MNITTAISWRWAANLVNSFPEALSPTQCGTRRQNRNKHRRPINEYDDDSPYLNTSTSRGIQGESIKGDEFQDWNDDDEIRNRWRQTQQQQQQQQSQEGYDDENGDWCEPEEPQGSYRVITMTIGTNTMAFPKLKTVTLH
jgi:hypothetical protein